MKRVLVLGGSSEIALAIIRRLAADGPVRPWLLGRDQERLAAAADALRQAGCEQPEVMLLDAEDVDAHERVIADAFAQAGGFEVVLLAVGILGDRQGLEGDLGEAVDVLRVNLVGGGSLMLRALARLKAQRSGTLIVLSSAAAGRPRRSNAVYGAAKAGLDALAQGLADEVAPAGVRVLVVRPGFVTTRMTAGLKPAPLATTPEAVADATVQGLAGRAHTVWVPRSLGGVIGILKLVPRPIYRRLPL
jgi:decaprenylphospho-beta-D-erythro-pentofuranosid-2-ulose 2-reductase